MWNQDVFGLSSVDGIPELPTAERPPHCERSPARQGSHCPHGVIAQLRPAVLLNNPSLRHPVRESRRPPRDQW
jgi:hypothetical protein